MSNKPSRDLQTFPNPNPDRPYHVHIEVPEFTCLCPLTGQPDFATLVIDYLPNQKNVELKSLKMYMWSYREEGAFHEAVTNKILDDLVAATDPRYMKLTANGTFGAACTPPWWLNTAMPAFSLCRKLNWTPFQP